MKPKPSRQSEYLAALMQPVDEIRGELRRLVLRGNAAGATAAITFLGVLIQQAEPALRGRPVFFITIVFLAGLTSNLALILLLHARAKKGQ